VRIGLIAPPWVPVPPPAYGGTESVIDRLARGLVRAGHDVLLAAAGNSTCPVPRVAGTQPVGPGAPVTGDTLTELRHVVTAYAGMTDVDVIHDHTLAGPLYRRPHPCIPVVTTNHGPFDEMLSPIYRALQDVPVIAISHGQAATAAGIRIGAVIHHGIDVQTVPVGRGDGGYASFLGRMCPEKGPREAALIARAAGVPLRMAAKLREPAEREYFEAAVEPLLCSDVEYVGELGLREKLELVGGSFALLNPLQWAEPFGLVMIEALATGTPVVATAAGSAPEIVDDGVTGFLRTGLPALAAALLEAPRLDRAVCRATAARRFDTDRMVADHLRLYEEAVCTGFRVRNTAEPPRGGPTAMSPDPLLDQRDEHASSVRHPARI
jgi:glycosyltransferase involved in cell wall biosynthesis